MLRAILSLLFLLCSASQIIAQSITIKCLDESGEALPGVAVKLVKAGDKNISEISLTNAEGELTLNIPAYPAQLEFSNIGYGTIAKTISKAPEAVLSIVLEKKYTGLNEVVITGVGKPTKLDEAVSVYRIITAAEIRAQGAVNLQDALRNQVGMSIGQDNVLGGTIRMQGLSGDNVKILVDGLPVNGRENQNVDLSTVNLANIERIEVAQGPMSIMYGADALGGVINLITKTNKSGWNAGSDAFYESIGKYNFSVNGAYQLGKSNISLTGGRNFFQGWDPLFDTVRNPLWRPKQQYFANLKYIYKISEDASVTYGSDYMNDRLYIKGGLDNFSPFVFTTPDEIITTQRWMNRLQFKWKTGEHGYWESNNSYSLYHRHRDAYLTDLTTLEKLPSPDSNANSITIFNDLTSRTTYNNKVGILNYTVGYDINLQFASGVEKIQGGKQNVGDYALFLITDIDVARNLKLQPALRGSYNTKYNAPLLPSLSVLFKPSELWSIRASYARGFRAPTLKELYLDFKDANHDVVGNVNLKPEDGHHIQLSGAYTITRKGADYCNVSLTGYYNDVRDMISLLPVVSPVPLPPGGVPPYTYTNIGRFKNLNFQLQSQTQWEHLNVVLGVAYNQNLKTDNYPAFHYWEANGNIRYDVPQWKAGIALFYKYTGSMPLTTADVIGGTTVSDSLRSKAFHNLDLSVNKGFWKQRLQITAGVRNIFDNTVLGITGGSTNGGTGNPHGGGNTSYGGINLTTGRSFFTSLSLRL